MKITTLVVIMPKRPWSTYLTLCWKSLLRKRLGFVITPRNISIKNIVYGMEESIKSLVDGVKEEVRQDCIIVVR
jgi:hypothetical protein